MNRRTFLAAAGIVCLTTIPACDRGTGETIAAAPRNMVASADGTRIAYARIGRGPAVIIVGGMLSDRKGSEPVARALSADHTVYTFDRRGRGESGDAGAYAVEREIEDLSAIQALAGGKAAIVGHSSGGGLALAAVAAGVPARSLVLYEPPFGDDRPENKAASARIDSTVRQLLSAGRHEEAIKAFLTYTGAPASVAEQAASNPATLKLAPSMPQDLDVMNMRAGSPLPEDRVKAVTVPTVVMVGSKAPPAFTAAADRIAALAANARVVRLDRQGHNPEPGVLADAIRAALR